MVATTSEVPAAAEVQKKKAAKATAAKKPTAKASAKKVDSVDKTADKSEDKVMPSKAKTSSKKAGSVRLDPNLALVPGNAVTFVAEAREGRVQAKIVTAKDSWIVAASVGSEARVSKILEVPGELTVEFYEDGKLYASGTWNVG
jgi:hypothetical protein